MIDRTKKKNGINLDLLPELSLCIMLCSALFGNGVRWILSGGISLEGNLFVTIFYATGLAFLLLSILLHLDRIKLDMIVLPISILLLLLFSMINSDTLYEVERQGIISDVFLTALPIYFSTRLVRNYQRFWRMLMIFSHISLLLMIASFFFANVGSRENYKTFSNCVIVIAGVYLIEWLYNDGKKWNAVAAMISFFLIATCGRRSSLVSLLLLAFIICIIKKKYKLIIAALILGLFLLFLWRPLIEYLYDLIRSFGVRPRILLRILEGNVTDDSYRFDQWQYGLGLLGSSFGSALFGLGLVGERHLYLEHFEHMSIHGYPHGIHIEMLLHFGLILGIALLLFLIVFGPIRFIRQNHLNTCKMSLFLLALTLFSTLFLQNSYVVTSWFYFYLAMLVPMITKRRKVKSYAADTMESSGMGQIEGSSIGQVQSSSIGQIQSSINDQEVE